MQTVLEATEFNESIEVAETAIADIPLSQRPIVYPIAIEAINEMGTRLTALVIGGIEDKVGMKAVHSGRMECVKLRGKIEAKRKELKADSIEFGKRVDSVAKTLTEAVLVIERDLSAKEIAIEQEQERIRIAEANAIYDARRKRIVEAGVEKDPRFSEAAVRQMTELCFNECLAVAIESARIAKEQAEAHAREEQERQRLAAEEAERNRIERERLAQERAEFERQREEAAAETARLQKLEQDRIAEERAAMEKLLAAVRAEQERFDEQQRQQQEAVRQEMARREATEREQREATERAERDRQEQAARAAAELAAQERAELLRPAKDKIERFAIVLESLSLPDVPQQARLKLADVIDKAAAMVRWIASDLV